MMPMRRFSMISMFCVVMLPSSTQSNQTYVRIVLYWQCNTNTSTMVFQTNQPARKKQWMNALQLQDQHNHLYRWWDKLSLNPVKPRHIDQSWKTKVQSDIEVLSSEQRLTEYCFLLLMLGAGRVVSGQKDKDITCVSRFGTEFPGVLNYFHLYTLHLRCFSELGLTQK